MRHKKQLSDKMCQILTFLVLEPSIDFRGTFITHDCHMRGDDDEEATA